MKHIYENPSDETLSSEICDKLSQYYSLKNEYETSLKNKKKACVSCGGYGGTSFTVYKNEENARILSAVCTSHPPCQMKIRINAGSFSNVHDDLQLHVTENNKSKRNIILFKNDVLFGINDNLVDANVEAKVRASTYYNNKNTGDINNAGLIDKYKKEENEKINVEKIKNLIEKLDESTEMKLLYNDAFYKDNDEISKLKSTIAYEDKIIKLLNDQINENDELLSNGTLKIIHEAYKSELFISNHIDFTSYTICNYFINIINRELLKEYFEVPENSKIQTIKDMLEKLLKLFNTIASYKYKDYNLIYDETANEVGLTKHNIYNMQLIESSEPSVLEFNLTPTTKANVKRKPRTKTIKTNIQRKNATVKRK